MKIVIDEERCMGHGQCELVAPELFKLDEQGMVVVLSNPTDNALRAKAELAAKRCPETVITIVDD